MSRLAFITQSYEWGKIGASSKVAQLAAASDPSSFKVDASKPYAELWLGTHPNGPSSLYSDRSTPLRKILNNENLTPELSAVYEGDLPFLLKVLSIGKALSIQAHPDKTLARQLHESRPDLYKDPNHKPEMALALTDFEAFIGFRPLAEISAHLKAFPEFSRLFKEETLKAFHAAAAGSPAGDITKTALRAIFSELMRTPQTILTPTLAALISRLSPSAASHKVGSVEELVLRLNEQYPGGDVGVFCTFLLNYVRLAEGAGIFLAANEPHAYLSGDIVECMAASDNVVRSGLTPKFKDVDTLVSMLTYNAKSAESLILKGTPFRGLSHAVLYDPPISEFSLVRVSLAASEEETIPGLKGPTILLVTSGSGFIETAGIGKDGNLGFGMAFFIGAGSLVKLKGGPEGLTCFTAFCEL